MLAKVDLIFDKDVIDGLKGQKLTDQIAAFALVCAPLLKAKDRNEADEKRKVIKDAIDQFGLGLWSVKPPHKEDSTEEEKEDAEDSEDSDN